MTKRAIIQLIFDGRRPPYVPWSFRFTIPAREDLSPKGRWLTAQ